jgi:hypothetical protein
MKTFLAITALCLIVGFLKIGYYFNYEDEQTTPVFFVKQSPTFRLEFHHIFANEGDWIPLARLRDDQRIKVIDYCKYRVGLVVQLKTEAELIVCSVR